MTVHFAAEQLISFAGIRTLAESANANG